MSFRTYTMLIKSPYITLSKLTIENTAGEGHIVGQAVALHLYADDINLFNCTLKALQDTIFLGPLSQDSIDRYVDLLPEDERVYLARPWRECGIVNFNNSYLDSHIIKEGFSIWEGTERHLNRRFYEEHSSGPGRNIEKRISWSHIKK